MGIFDVPAAILIEEIAKDLKKNPDFKQPGFVVWVKTGRHTERAPQRDDWFFVRTASVFYRVYKEGPLGTESLRTYYGGKRNRGVRPHRFFKAGGKVLRVALQELEKLGYVKKEKKGRVVTGKGESYLVKKSKEVEKVVEEYEREAEGRKIEKEKMIGDKVKEKKVSEELKKAEEKEKKKGKKEKKKEKPKKERKEGAEESG